MDKLNFTLMRSLKDCPTQIRKYKGTSKLIDIYDKQKSLLKNAEVELKLRKDVVMYIEKIIEETKENERKRV